MTGSDELALTSEERRVVDAEEHAHRRLIDLDRRKRLRIFPVSNGIADLETFDADNGADVPALNRIHLGLSKAVKNHQVLYFLFFLNVISLAESDVHACSEGTSGNPSDCNPSHVRRIFERRNQHLRSSFILFRSRNHLQNRIEKSSDVVCRLFPVIGHPSLLCTSVNSLEIKLVLSCPEREHQVENLFLNLIRTAVQLVNLIYHHNRLLSHFNCFLKHEPCLRHTAFKCVHKQKDTVSHVEHALDLASEVAMARSVYHIDFHSLICN